MDFVRGDSGYINWERRIAVAKRKLGLWQLRPLSLSGKVMVLKADILSSLVYLSVVFPLAARLRSRLSRAVFKFMWGL